MLYSAYGDKMERDANLFAGELILDDADILDACFYESYQRTADAVHERAARYRTNADRQYCENDAWRDFYQEHPDMPSYADLAYEYEIDVHLVEFKFYALRQKGYDVPNLPEVNGNFLRRD